MYSLWYLLPIVPILSRSVLALQARSGALERHIRREHKALGKLMGL